ncbi:MAG: hypothetical protein AAF664_17810 [Planctomycetota bacterium]
MEGITEPCLAILGHPIAGNPSQLAIERALKSIGKDWRVSSFDVAPKDFDKAMAGLDVLGFHGVWLDSTLSNARNLADPSKGGDSKPQAYDMWSRDDDGELSPISLRQGWLSNQLEKTPKPKSPNSGNSAIETSEAGTLKAESISAVLFGELDSSKTLDCELDAWMKAIESLDIPITQSLEVSDLLEANLVILPPGGKPIDAEDLDLAKSASSPKQPLLMNFSAHEIDPLKSFRLYVGSSHQMLAEVLANAVEVWTKDRPDESMLFDAIEEYFAV